MKAIKNKTVLITGASSGIGKAFAENLAQKGANLILTARSKDALHDLASSLREKYKVEIMVIAGDLAKPATPAAIVEEIRRSGLQVDLLINNAGFGMWGRFESAGSTIYQEMIHVNINAVVALTHLLIPEIVKNRGGVINVASTGAFQPVPYIAVYCATKAFVLSFSEALSGEYHSSGVKVMALCPGNTTSGFQSVANANIAGQRVDTAERVAEEGIKAFLNGKSYKVVGVDNYVNSLVPRFLSRGCITFITKRMFQKRVAF